MADLVGPNARAPEVAAWDHPLAAPNIEDATISHALAGLGRVPGLGRLEAAYRARFRLKSWQYMTAVTDDLIIAFVVGTAGFASNGFVYAVERATGAVHKKFAITPFSVGTRVAPTSAAGGHAFATRGLDIAIDSRDGGRGFAVAIDAHTEGGGRLAAELRYTSRPADQHLAVCVPLPGNRWNYTHKFAAFEVAGQVAIERAGSAGPRSAAAGRRGGSIDGRTVPFVPGSAWGTLDFTKMYALRHAVWRWITVCGRSRRGAVVGLNLVDPTPDAAVSENAVWVDGVREPLAGVQLVPAGDAADASWRCTAASVDLEMRAVAHVEQRLDVPLVRHRLRHVVGAFSGRVRTASGQIHELDDLVGIAEDYDTWW